MLRDLVIPRLIIGLRGVKERVLLKKNLLQHFSVISAVALVRRSVKRETHSKSGLTFQGSLYLTVYSIKYCSTTE